MKPEEVLDQCIQLLIRKEIGIWDSIADLEMLSEYHYCYRVWRHPNGRYVELTILT